MQAGSKKYYCDMLIGIYRSLVATAYFNRALNIQLREGQLSSDAKKDLARAMAYVGSSGRGGEALVVEAIRSFEKGTPIQKIEQIRQNILV
ncbi:MAG: hypothetical protein HWD61_03440 [Parachlamydiaceae bacterium]|nr:MAG: hypothetical protein HWD61_03440 [Parachlamydiaceae bacterium]